MTRRPRAKRLSAVLATAALAGASLLADASGAAVGRIRSSEDYRLRGFDAENPLRAKNAPGLAVHPTDPNRIVELQMDLNNQTCEWNTSTDGGTTWPFGGVLVPPAGFNQDAPCNVLGHGANAVDAGVEWGSGNNVYIVWGSGPVGGATSALLSKSIDGGQTFLPPVVAMEPFPTGNPNSPFSDNAFPKLDVKPDPDGAGPLQDQIIVTSEGVTPLPGEHASTGQVRTAVSTDAGATFAGPVIASPAVFCPDPPNRSVTGITTTTGSTTITSATPVFTASDVGSRVSGGGFPPSTGNTNITTITAVNSPTSATVSQPATRTAPVDNPDPTPDTPAATLTISKTNVSAADVCPQPFGAVEHTQPRYGPGGEIYVGWRTSASSVFSSFDPRRANGFLRVAKSTDNGASWTYTNVINVAGPVYNGPVTPPYGSSPTIFTASSFARLAVNPTTGALYVVWNQDPHLYGNNPGFSAQDHFMHNRSQVYFIRSTDANASWGGLRRVSETPISPLPEHDRLNPETQTRHPNIEVAPDGRIDIAWQDRRHAYRPCVHTHVACNEARLGDTYYSYSENGGTSFSANRRIQDRHHNNDVGFDYRFSTYWDFGPVFDYLSNDRLLFAWMDSREGNFENDTQDIYLAKTNLRTGRGVAPVRSVDQLLPRYQDVLEETRLDIPGPPVPQGNLGDPPSLAAAMSQLAQPGGGEAVLAGTFASRAWTQVVIAPQNDPASMLAGGVLARANVGPLLLSGPNKLPPATRAEAARVQPRYRDDEAVPSRTGTDASTLVNSNTITCPSCNFGPDDVGALVRNSNLSPDTFITSVTDPTTVVVSNPAASTSGAPGSLTIARQVGAFVIGNKSQIRDQVITELSTATGLPVSTIKRISGTPADIARQIALQMDRRTATQRTEGVPAFDAAVIVNPTSPDSAAVSTLAAHRRLPVLFTDQNSVPPETTAALTALNINKVLIIGGEDDVSAGVQASLAAFNPTRLGGADQFATSIAVLQESIARGLPTNQIFVADGNDPRHGSLLGASSARIGGLLLLVPGGGGGDAQSIAGGLGLDNKLDRFITSKLGDSFSFPTSTSSTIGT